VKLPDTGGVEIATQNFNQYSWIFGTDGDLIIPGDIRSEGNINIDINLSDSTLRRWQFGEDGDLTLPTGGDIKDSEGNSVLGGGNADTGNFTFSDDTITNNDGLILSTNRGTLAMGTDMEVPGVAQHFHIAFDGSNSNPPASDLFLGDDNNYVKLPGYELNPTAQFGVEIGTNNRSLGPQNIEVFTVDELDPPGGVWRLFIIVEDYPNLGSAVSVGDTVTTTWGTPITATITDVVEDSGNWQIHINQDITAGFNDYDTVSFGASGGSHVWRFGTDGNLTLPAGGDIVDSTGTTVLGGGGSGLTSNDDITITVNSEDSSSYTWNFGQTGVLTFPSGNMTMGDLDGVEGIRGGVDSTIGILSLGTSGASVLQWVDDLEEATATAAVVVNSLFAPNTGTVQIFTGDVGPAPEHSWTFGTDGALTLPTGGHIGPSGGKGLGTTYGGANDHLVSLTSYYDSGLYSSCVTAYADGTLNITAYNDGGPNPAKIWTFDNTGTLTLPDDSGIKSSTNIDITIDTPDSSTFNWQFGADGALTLPGGRTRIGTAVGTDAIIANEDEAFAVVTQGTNGSGILIWIEDPENFGTSNLAAVYTNPEGSGTVRIATGANGPGGGPKFWTFNDAGALTFPQGTTFATADGTDAFLIDGAADKDVQIYTYSGETAHGWRFGTDGSLQIPGDIKSNGNINIDINLADSTLRRWQFGEDGSLRLPIGVSIDDNVDPLYPKIIADSGKLFSVQAQGTTGSAALAWSVDPNADTKYAAVGVSQGGGDNLAKVVMTAGNTTATLKVWKLDETGVFTLPQGGVIDEGNSPTGVGKNITLKPQGGTSTQALLIYPTAGGEGDHIHLTAGGGSTELYLGDDDHYVKLASNGFVVIKADDGVSGKVWGFSPDGTTSIPGDIKSDSNINIEINLSDSTLRRWQFGEDGNLETPGGIQVAGILKIDDGVHEKLQTKADATGTVTHDCSLGHIFYHTSPDANWTANFTNLNLSTGYVTAVSLIIVQGATGYYPTVVQIGGVSQTINWQGNTNPTPSSSRTDVVTFSIICTATDTYTVLGQLTGF
jgi:hypothetical protein